MMVQFHWQTGLEMKYGSPGFILIRNAHKVEPQMPLPDNYSSHGMVDSVGCLICGMEGKASGFCSIHMLPQGLISHTDPFFFFM